MNIVSFHKRDLQLVTQYLSIARITRLSEGLRFFRAPPNIEHNYLPHANGFSNKPNAVYNYKVAIGS